MKKLWLVLLLAGATGCSMFGSVASGAGDQAGRNFGASLVGSSNATQASYGGGGNLSMATMNPAFLNIYMGFIFTYAFSSGGYDVAPVDYKAGQYTRWSGKGRNGKPIGIERAHLFDQGRQWWKVKFTDDQNKTTILEGLLDPKQQKFVRMRAKFPDDKEGNELPMDEQSYYHPAQKLSKDSVEGATKGIESVNVPAGAFTAKHVVFGGAGGTSEWWLYEKVPGGTVKQLSKNPRSNEDQWAMELTAYGDDARTELDTK
jgi:hypothetical protein